MKKLLSKKQIEGFPVRHLSASAIRTYLTDRQLFFKRYVKREYDETMSPALLEGKAMHAVLEVYWKDVKAGKAKDFDWDGVIEEQEQVMALQDSEGKVKWGKTGSLEKSQKSLRKAIGFYREETPKYKNIVAVEDHAQADFEDLEGNDMPIPLKGFTDLIIKRGKKIVIRDYKLVSAVIPQNEVAPAYEIQACIYWFLVRKKYGINPTEMIFDQVKKSKNKDGSPQVVPYSIKYTSEILERFLEIYSRIVREMSGTPLCNFKTGVMECLPNPYSLYGWQDSWAEFCKEVKTGKKLKLKDLPKIKEKAGRDDCIDALDI